MDWPTLPPREPRRGFLDPVQDLIVFSDRDLSEVDGIPTAKPGRWQLMFCLKDDDQTEPMRLTAAEYSIGDE